MEKSLEKLISLLRQSGESGYIGEEVTQLEHALQGAHFASKAGADDEMILAVLFHDVGHFCEPGALQMADLGVMNHEALGGHFLRQHGFSSRLAHLVSQHVNAKRYLVTTRETYKSALSEASRKTLEFQGGFMTREEIQEFERLPDFKNLLKIRAWDDQAKIKGLQVATLETYVAKIRSHLASTSKGEA